MKKDLPIERSIITLLLIILFWLGCSNQQTADLPEHIRNLENVTIYSKDAEPAHSIRFERETIFDFNKEDSDPYIGSMENFAVDDKNRVFVYSRNNIYVINPDGSYLTAMGGEGRGPGEFHRFANVKLRIGLNRLFAYDEIQQRINVYSMQTLSSSPSKTILMDPDQWRDIEELKRSKSRPISHFYIRSDSTLMLAFRQPFPTGSGLNDFLDIPAGNPNPEVEKYKRYYRMNMGGQIISDKIFELKDVNFYPGTVNRSFVNGTLPSTRSSLIAVSDKGKIFSAWTEEFLIKVHDSKGQYLRSFYYPFENSTLNPEKILNQSYTDPSPPVRQYLEDADFPETWPALNIILLDDQNRLWVSTITDEEENYEWWILNEMGKLLAKFKWPGKKLFRHSDPNEIQLVKNGYLYVLKTDDETGLQQIVKYRIEMD